MPQLLKLLTLASIVSTALIFAGQAEGAPVVPVVKRGPKKILLAFDGTTNNARQSPNKETDLTLTHILRLHLFAGGEINGGTHDAESKSQISLYEEGIGGKTESTLFKVLRGVAGRLSLQTRPMKKRLEEIYQPGDKLYIVGYSRGAASARKFAAILNSKGLKLKDGTKVKQPEIECVGCFETVSMQMLTRPLQLLNTRLTRRIAKSKWIGEKGVIAPNVKKGIHNVAIDDNRMWRGTPVTFNPILMGSEDNVVETWFAGEHGDVGGSYYTKGMPDTSLKYMMEFMEGGLGKGNNLKFIKAKHITPENIANVKNHEEININPVDLTVSPNTDDSGGGIHLMQPMQVENPSHRPIYAVKNDKMVEGATIKIHESVLHHMEDMKKVGKKYAINPNIKKTDFEVVGPLGKEVKSKTMKLASNLENDYA